MFGAIVTLAQGTGADFIWLQKDDVELVPRPGGFNARHNIIVGDPSEEGIYVMRIEFGANATSPPHFHDQDRFITVISGEWGFGRGASGDCAKTIPMTEGAFIMHPKGAVHYDGSCNGEPVVVQIIGMGPVTTTRVEVSE